MKDTTLLEHINALIEEEQRLRDTAERPEQFADRISHIEDELDQCWDLLRQRRAKREFGDNPDSAQPRDVKTVRNYLN